MKKTAAIIIGFIAALGILTISNTHYAFSFGDSERLDKGWKAYERKEYSFAIAQFVTVDLKEHPEIVIPLANSYLQVGEPYNAIRYLEPAYQNKNYSMDDHTKIINLLGRAYIEDKEYKKGRLFMEESRKLGNSYSERNFNILDSLERNQIK
ncbi:hypothetical protein QWZ06_20670 [Chryseobacterium tructae]|uniref:Tetratricopeptide repeat protein n=1 Tax=Chryseobacterium tructae TaxID=1037380 RepID=A0ABV7Y0M4_9FLAO|nr:hypothetical protein [Chryseobacterium tructae]MDN3694505.1 hypothetical protein [Chryseobacterium tructae]